MRLPLALATLFLAATTALPAFAATPAPIGVSLLAAATTPVEAVQNRQTTRKRTARNTRRGYNAYAAAPRARSGYSNPWGRCVHLSPRAPGASAYPEWDLC